MLKGYKSLMYFFGVMAGLCLIFQCRESQDEITNESKKREAEIGTQPDTSKIIKPIFSICNCLPTINKNASEGLRYYLFYNKIYKSYEIIWKDSCQRASNDTMLNKTNIYLCYNKDTISGIEAGIIAKINSLPSCLNDCYLHDNICIKVKVTGGDNLTNFILTGSYIGVDFKEHPIKIIFKFNSTMQISICCENGCYEGDLYHVL